MDRKREKVKEREKERQKTDRWRRWKRKSERERERKRKRERERERERGPKAEYFLRCFLEVTLTDDEGGGHEDLHRVHVLAHLCVCVCVCVCVCMSKCVREREQIVTERLNTFRLRYFCCANTVFFANVRLLFASEATMLLALEEERERDGGKNERGERCEQ